ncbi:BEL1-like homeodomain protein 7 [Punica granatum]|uniref:BEL1-like homeodomain protein 7 n=2 Tax=Punica granatum TaxID=22663 RepID=A0A6P8CEM8_PUNGR|nr:BEL1-like homeodomain protein 7 [Punica granatum]XP_031381477.1 BEL1-like homeodomain protein 7 [Punica granatum]XP_031381478.1 BEL1-like homeodomain protein 7 [Punica granatum]XP_031381479.1 BEL1-like homeodomain protein 7 [Punica granatum]XP_031381480.1 BEL1-like homeodomain protein 7 [Punica granatum]PKI38607.1 hypothetical protein CRG98_041040 [Punica granatum]
MGTYYMNLNNQREYTREEHLSSSHVVTPVFPGTMMYNSSGSFSGTLTGNSEQQSSCIQMQRNVNLDSTPRQQQEILSSLGRNEMLFAHPVGGHTGLLQSVHNLQGQGLSLSLGTQIPSGYAFLSPNPSLADNNIGRNGSLGDEPMRNLEFIPQSFMGSNQDLGRMDLSGTGRAIPNSRYLKAVQQLLDEVVNVRKALKQSDDGKSGGARENQVKRSKEGDEGSTKDDDAPSGAGGESDGKPQKELSHAEKQELQHKLTKLLSMLDEVDRRYKQYYHQMQIIVSSFDVIAGSGAAKPYTALALQTISRHFRCLRDAIAGQIQATRESLGEQDSSGNGKGVGISRLRYVDQQLRQQRALQQLGMMQQHVWRPQRGLPENSVSILRAWLFEHFLHPYPKDSDKIMLARQTGLTRSQVSNWFINARVRLWKPMVEEMYKEETGDMDLDSNSSSENVSNPSKADHNKSSAQTEDLQQQSIAATSRGQIATESKPDHAPDMEMIGSTGGIETIHSGLFSGTNRFMTAAAYHMPELGRFGTGSGVSLTLGLQHCDGTSMPLSGTGTAQGFLGMRGDGISYTAEAASSAVAENAEFETVNMGTQQHRFGPNGHLLHDFVA